MIGLWFLAGFVLFWVLAYFRVALALSTVAYAVLVSAALYIHSVGPFGWSVAAIIFLVIAVPLNVLPLRRALFSSPALRIFRKIMPAMSDTEREAIEAGTVWWDAQLFSGKPDWRKLLASSRPTLTQEERDFIDGPVETLCGMIDDWRISSEFKDLPPEVWQFMKDKGFFGMIIPKEYGGLGFTALGHSNVVMKVASRSITAAVTVMVPNSLGPAELLLHYGTDEQKQHYLPKLATGEEMPCFALTGPEAGSDAGAMPDNGVVCRGEFEGKDVLGIRLNWDKRYITLGPVATVLGLAFKLYDPDHLLGEKDSLGITLALIPTDTAGITIGRRHNPLDNPFQNGPNQGKDVFIPIDWVIGGQEQVGKGWRMLMESLAAGRSISLPALSTGGCKTVARVTGAYARVRRQFKVPIGKFEGVDEALARLAGYAYMTDAARTLTLAAVDAGEKPSVMSAIVKYHLTETMRRSINDAMDVQGGSGICMGPKNFLGRAYQALPIAITVEGANILTRSLIIYGQGAIRCHPYVFAEMQAVADDDHKRALVNFDKALFGHIGFAMSNAMRSLFLAMTGGYFVRIPVSGRIQRYYQLLTRMSSSFAFVSDVCMLVFGGALKRKERISGRLGDILSYMYLASATLKRFEDQGRPDDDLPLMRWVCLYCLHNIERSFSHIMTNFPVRPIAWLMRMIVFPIGRHFHEPTDRLGNEIAAMLLQPSAARDRLTRGIFINEDPNDATGRIESALPKVIAAEPVERKLRQAERRGDIHGETTEALVAAGLKAQLINEQEAKLVNEASAARLNAIAVDDFATL
ncbi:MAG: acyl-CoA dehydrogenase [Acidiferrobacterales bacterium]